MVSDVLVHDALTNHWKKCYEAKYDVRARINREGAGWVWKSMLKDYSKKQIMELISFFFEHYIHKDHDFTWFKYNYEKVDEAMDGRNAETAHIDKLREESQKRIKEHRENLERIKSNRLNAEGT